MYFQLNCLIRGREFLGVWMHREQCIHILSCHHFNIYLAETSYPIPEHLMSPIILSASLYTPHLLKFNTRRTFCFLWKNNCNLFSSRKIMSDVKSLLELGVVLSCSDYAVGEVTLRQKLLRDEVEEEQEG